jgi:hypothetical protein
MSHEEAPPSHVITVPRGTPVYALPVVVDGQEMEQYIFGEGARDDIPVAGDDATVDAESLFGAWADLDRDVVADELDQIRHDSPPTPPFEFPGEEDSYPRAGEVRDGPTQTDDMNPKDCN